ncbi:hypothetical protein [Geodermatophilus maliterrae]|uniref:Type I restriction modification DNA specificity domain-containing protein n=1 Tax=Geodermatophilus maliterrae TaxID=3162531 RepID=A0ABV3XCP4_9ACTN
MQQHFNVGAAKEMMLALPPLREQQGIAATLRALDDKAASNQQLRVQIPNLIRALVLRAIDLSADRIPVADLASFINGGAYTKGASGTGRIVIRIAELNSGPGASTVYSDIDVPDDRTARAGDILMSWSGSLDVYRWYRDEAIINQHIFKVLPANGYPAWFVFDRLGVAMPVFHRIAKDKATTMGHIQRGHLQSTFVDVPHHESLSKLSREVESLWNRLLLAERENVKLEHLRKSLLPELLSGRVRVPEAMDAVQEVVA